MELGSNFLSGIFVGALFLIKIWFLIFWVEYVEQEARKELDKEVSKNKIHFNAFKRCLTASLILTFIYYGYDGYYCTEQDMCGCYDWDYDDDFVPRTIDNAAKYFGTLLSVTLAGSIYKLNKFIY